MVYSEGFASDVEEENLDQELREVSLPVELIRAVAIVLVIMLHATIEPYVLQMTQEGVLRWWTVNIYNSLATPCIPLFVMLSGALLLQPSKIEPLRVFFKKRWNRIGLPFIFWGAAYFAWSFLVNHEPFSFDSIVRGILTGPYYHFWFLYMLIGLYLLTPILRVVVANADRKILKYFILLWFFGVVIVPLLGLFGYSLDSNVFVISGWMGYFLLGTYLLTVRMRSWTLYILLFLSLASMAVATYFMTAYVGGKNQYFFYGFLSANVILASVALFPLLCTVRPNRIKSYVPGVNLLLHQISFNTLPIYLFHVIVLETLQRGYVGFKISITTMNPILEVPLITVVTLFISLGLILLLKKIPHIERIIG
jgi:surface polysaccharide O-acyltransferase-like enzyme